MLKKIIQFSLFSILTLGSISAKDSDEKMYIDDEEFVAHPNRDAFYIHTGNNVWLVTNVVYRDDTGLFTYQCNIHSIGNGFKMEHEKKWKCPYCYQYWPIGKPCANKDCPSKFK